MSIWDDPEIKSAGNYVKLENEGDEVSGVILAISRQNFDTGPVPQLILRGDDGEERTYTAGQIQAKVKLVELRPEVGDWIRVALTRIEKRGGGKTLKHIDVEHRKGNGTVPAAPAKVAAAGADKPPF